MLLLFLFAYLSVVFGNLQLYSVPGGVPASDKFQVSVQQGHRQKQTSFTYISKSDRRLKDSKHVKGGRSVSWTSFSFSGIPVTLEIHTPHDFHKCIVRPKSYGFHCQRAGAKTAHVVVNSNGKQMSIEFDNDYGSNAHDIKDKLLVFVDSPETDVPNPHGKGVLYYGPGVHNLNGNKALDSSITEVYLAPGSFIQGGFHTTANHPVKIHGRGVISNEKYPWHDSRFEWAAIRMDSGSGHVIEGVTISDPAKYYIRALGSHNTVRNVKTVAAWTYNSDGVATGSNGLVENSFFMANDDSIKLYADNITVRHCVVWQCQNGAVFQTGWWSSRSMHHVRVSDVDVIHTDWCTFKGGNCHMSGNDAVIDQAGKTDHFSISDIEFKDIRVEGSCPRIINFALQSGATGSISDVRLIDWSVESQPTHDSLHNVLAGSDHVRINNWQFTNFKIGNKCVNNPANSDFVIDHHTTRNIPFHCIDGPQIVG